MKIAVIPARSGSKRIKNKNVREFFGQPLISYSLRSAQDSGIFDKIHVSTDSSEIAETAANLGFPVDFLRSPELADDHAPLVPVLKFVLDEYAKRDLIFDDVCLLLPTAPLVEGIDLVRAFDIYEKNQRKYATLAASPFPVPVEWAYERDPTSGKLTPTQPGMADKRSQDLNIKYFDAGVFCFFNRAHIYNSTAIANIDFTSYIIPKEKAVDIDEEGDFALAEILFAGRDFMRKKNDEQRNNHDRR